MTIRELIDNGIEIQGKVVIKGLNNDTEVYETLHDTIDFKFHIVPNKRLDMTVEYMYCDSDGYMNIEVKM